MEAMQLKKNEIQDMGLNAIMDFFKLKPEDINKDTIQVIHNKAKLAMQFEREMNLSKRAIELNYIRVFRMVASDKKELKSLIRKSMPQYMN